MVAESWSQRGARLPAPALSREDVCQNTQINFVSSVTSATGHYFMWWLGTLWESTLRARVPKKSGEGAASDLRGDVCWAIGRPGSRFLWQVLR